MAIRYSCVCILFYKAHFLENGHSQVRELVVIIKIRIAYLYILLLTFLLLLLRFDIIKIHLLLLMNSLKVVALVPLLPLLVLVCLDQSRTWLDL